MLKKRVITALCGLPILIAAVWFDKPIPWFTLLVAIWGVIAALEFYRLVTAAKVPPLTYFGLVWTLLFILSGDATLRSRLEPYFDLDLIVPLLLTIAVVIPLIGLLLRPQKAEGFTSWAWTLAGILYVGWLLSCLVALRGAEDGPNTDYGRNLVFFALFTTFASDTAAFFVGRAWGRRKLAPDISPAKTWEGAIAGVGGAILISLIFVPGYFFTWPNPLHLHHLGYWSAVLLGLFVSILGQVGDLAESLFKRNMGVKDSSQLIPGHGGLLDRMDSIAFAGVVVYFYMILLIG
jgi:phosphatidate cytidylyltransferase